MSEENKLVLQFMRATMRKSDSDKLWRSYLTDGSPYRLLVDHIKLKHPDVWFKFQAWKAAR